MGSVPFVAFSWTTAARLTDLTPQSICDFFPESLIAQGRARLYCSPQITNLLRLRKFPSGDLWYHSIASNNPFIEAPLCLLGYRQTSIPGVSLHLSRFEKVRQ